MNIEDIYHEMNEIEYNNRLNHSIMTDNNWPNENTPDPFITPDDIDNRFYREPVSLPMQVLSMIDTNKAQREQFVQEVIEGMQEGKVDPLKIHVQVKCMEQIIKMFTDGKDYPKTSKAYKELVLDEATKHGKKFEYHNAEFKIGEVGTKYDYSQCGDEELLKSMAIYEAMGEAIKKRQEFLKTLPSEGLSQVDEATGDVVKLWPPSKSSTTSVSVSLSK